VVSVLGVLVLVCSSSGKAKGNGDAMRDNDTLLDRLGPFMKIEISVLSLLLGGSLCLRLRSGPLVFDLPGLCIPVAVVSLMLRRPDPRRIRGHVYISLRERSSKMDANEKSQLRI